VTNMLKQGNKIRKNQLHRKCIYSHRTLVGYWFVIGYLAYKRRKATVWANLAKKLCTFLSCSRKLATIG
jgi:hypothetical protein